MNPVVTARVKFRYMILQLQQWLGYKIVENKRREVENAEEEIRVRRQAEKEAEEHLKKLEAEKS